MTLQQFFNKWDGHAEEKLNNYKAEWTRTRWLATLFIQPHLKKGKKITPQQLCQFEWEKTKSKANKEIDELSKEDRDKFFEDRFKRTKKTKEISLEEMFKNNT